VQAHCFDDSSSIACGQLKIHLRGAPQPEHQPQRSCEQKRRRIKPRRRTRERHGRHRVPQNREQGVAKAVQKHDDGVHPCQRTQASHSAPRHRGKAEQHSASHDQSGQPLPKLERGHGKPPPALTQDGHGRVIHGKKAGRGLIQDVQRKSHAQRKPSTAKARSRKCGCFPHGDSPIPRILSPAAVSVIENPLLKAHRWTPGNRSALASRFTHQRQQVSFRVAKKRHP